MGNRIIATLALALCSVAGFAQSSVRVDVEAVRTSTVAGPYARYARQLLGINASEESLETIEIKSVTLSDERAAEGVRSASFRVEGSVEPNFDDVPQTAEMIAATTIEQKAKAAADAIKALRAVRKNILSGDTDASFTGNALGDAMNEIIRQENLFLKLFLGYTTQEKMSRSFIVDLKPGVTSYVVFRVSDTSTLVDAGYPVGRPYILNVTAEPVTEKGATDEQLALLGKRQVVVEKTIPAVCSLSLSDGMSVIVSTRALLPEFGKTIKVIENK